MAPAGGRSKRSRRWTINRWGWGDPWHGGCGKPIFFFSKRCSDFHEFSKEIAWKYRHLSGYVGCLRGLGLSRGFSIVFFRAIGIIRGPNK